MIESAFGFLQAFQRFPVLQPKRQTVETVKRNLIALITPLKPGENESEILKPMVVPLLADGTVHPVIDRTYPLEEMREAHARLESNESFGKIVLVIS